MEIVESYENKMLMEIERLNDNEVREVAKMQRIIDTLESAIASLHETVGATNNCLSECMKKSATS